MRILSLISVAAVAVAASHHGAILNSVPMQGPMVHIQIRYSASSNRLNATVEPVVPELLALAQSHPGDSFAIDDPWHDALDPSRRGLCFNRQYGLVMDALTDQLPEGTGIWIRQISASPGLETCRYRGSDPKQWEPLFENNSLLEWGLSMFHPAYAAPQGSGLLEASYEAVAINLESGSPRLDIEPAPFTLTWDAGGARVPELSIELMAVIRWPDTGATLFLDFAPNVNGPWQTFTVSPILLDTNWTVLVPVAQSRSFFRLRSPDPGARVPSP